MERISSPVPFAVFPAPPPFWRNFTTYNLDRLQELEAQSQSQAQDGAEDTATTVPDLPYTLLTLRPPPPPGPDTPSYTLFKKIHYLPPRPTTPINEAETEHLPARQVSLFDFNTFLQQSTGSARPHVRRLWQLTKSLNLNFLELITVMGDCPEDGGEKVQDIDILLQNVHGIINCLRPHQAREGVKSMLLDMLEKGREEIERMDRAKGEIEEFLRNVEEEGKVDTTAEGRKDAIHDGINGVNGVHARHNEQKTLEVEKARAQWELLNSLDAD